jgi:hypothetical protein
MMTLTVKDKQSPLGSGPMKTIRVYKCLPDTIDPRGLKAK